MAQFRYRAINKTGKVIVGSYTSSSEWDLEAKLKSLNLELLSCQEYRPLLGFLRKRKVDRRDLINYCFYLEQMTRSGITLIDALSDLRDSTEPSYLSEVIAVQVVEIQQGKVFAETLKGFPEIFSSSFVSLIMAGEKSGELTHVLKDLTETLTWQDELMTQTKKALMVPAFMSVLVFGVVFFLMTFLVPELISFISTMGQELPLHTIILIAVSDFFVAHWPIILITPVLFIWGFREILKRNVTARLLFDRYKLKIWVFGPILEKIILARFANYLALLYNSGIPVIESITITESVVDNKSVEQALKDVRNMISEGATIGLAFEMIGIFPKLVLSMINVGEKTGDLSTSLQNVSYFYKRDVDDAVDNLQQMIEPGMTVILGLIIGWVIMAVLGPIYDLISNIKM